jgi:hypothetical protein
MVLAAPGAPRVALDPPLRSGGGGPPKAVEGAARGQAPAVEGANRRNDSLRVAIAVNGDRRATVFCLPAAGGGWRMAIASDTEPRDLGEGSWHLPGRSVAIFEDSMEVIE